MKDVDSTLGTHYTPPPSPSRLFIPTRSTSKHHWHHADPFITATHSERRVKRRCCSSATMEYSLPPRETDPPTRTLPAIVFGSGRTWNSPLDTATWSFFVKLYSDEESLWIASTAAEDEAVRFRASDIADDSAFATVSQTHQYFQSNTHTRIPHLSQSPMPQAELRTDCDRSLESAWRFPAAEAARQASKAARG